MAGVRRHCEMSAVMVREHLQEIRRILPELADLLSSPANLAAFYTGTVWADWTHIASNIKKVPAFLNSHAFFVQLAIQLGIPLAGLIQKLDHIASIVDQDMMDCEYEHFVPGLLRYVAFLRSYAATSGIQDKERVAFLLGLVSHMYQDIVFHTDGVRAFHETDFITAFARVLSWEAPSGTNETHQKIEYYLDFYDWLTSSLNDEVERRTSFSVQALYQDFNVVYHLLGRTLLEQEDWEVIEQIVDLVQWKLARHAPQAIAIAGMHPYIDDLQTVASHPDVSRLYYRGGLLNGANVTCMGILLWYARLQGWYLYQNEVRSAYYETDSTTSYMLAGKPERKYLPYLGVTDATIDEANPTANTGAEPLLDVSAYGKRALLRFHISDINRATNDIDGRARSLWHTTTVEQGQLWLYFAGRKTIQRKEKILQVYKVNRPWNEGSGYTDLVKGDQGSQAKSGEVCYTYAAYTQHAWQGEGCDDVPADRDGWPPVTSLAIPPTMAANQWICLDITSAVQSWIDDPASNCGLLLLLKETDENDPSEDILQFYSSQANLAGDPLRGPSDRMVLHPLLLVKPRARWQRLDAYDLRLADDAGWDQAPYYATIQTQVVHRDEKDQLVLLARGSGGMNMWRFDFERKTWEGLASNDPRLTDDHWNHQRYYSTIQTQVVRRNGEDQLVMLARGIWGIHTWQFNFARLTWEELATNDPPLSDQEGWNVPQYYSTIQACVVQRDGGDQLMLLARGSGGINTWRFNFERKTWESLASNNPALADGEAHWDEVQYYSTIQTQVVQDQGQEALFLLARGFRGMRTWRFHFTSLTWDEIATNDPPFTDAGGWLHVRYNSTIQTQAVHVKDAQGERDVLYLLARSAESVLLYQLADRRWELVNSELAFSDMCSWDQEKYFATITLFVAGSREQNQQLLLFARRSAGMDTYRYDAPLHAWQQMTSADPAWGDVLDTRVISDSPQGWVAPQGYRTIQARTLKVHDEQQVILLGRAPAGIETYELDFGPATRWLG